MNVLTNFQDAHFQAFCFQLLAYYDKDALECRVTTENPKVIFEIRHIFGSALKFLYGAKVRIASSNVAQ